MAKRDGPPRKQIDLSKLPAIWRYSIALATAAIVMTIAYIVGRRNPPGGLTIPVLAWLGVAALLTLGRARR